MITFTLRYVPCHVDHDHDFLSGTFTLHQGIQRRIAMTLVQENNPELIWRDVREVVVGRIRNTPEWTEPDGEFTVMSLNILGAHYIKYNNDKRYISRK